MSRFGTLVLSLLVAACPVLAQPVDSAGKAKAIAPYVDQNTLAIVRLDATRLDLEAVFGSKAPESIRTAGGTELGKIRTVAEDFRKAGGRDLYVLMQMALPPVLVVPLYQDSKADALKQLLSQAGATTRPAGESTGPTTGPGEAQVEQIGNALVMGAPGALKALRALKPADRPEVAEAFAAAGNTACQVLLFLPEQARQEIEKELPALPREFGGGRTDILVRGIRAIALGVDPPPNLSFRLVVQCRDDASAKAVHELATGMLKAMTDNKPLVMNLVPGDLLAKHLSPALDGDRLVVRLDSRQTEAALADIAVAALARAREMARLTMSADNLKNIMRGCALYAADHEGQFPPDLAKLIQLDLIKAEMLTNPARPDAVPGYVYLFPKVAAGKMKNPGEVILIYENYEDKWGDGIAVGFADYRVVFVKDQEKFKKLLEASKALREEGK